MADYTLAPTGLQRYFRCPERASIYLGHHVKAQWPIKELRATRVRLPRDSYLPGIGLHDSSCSIKRRFASSGIGLPGTRVSPNQGEPLVG